MAAERVQWGQREGDGPLGNFERYKIAQVVEEHIHAHQAEMSREEFQWWSDVDAKLLTQVGDDYD